MIIKARQKPMADLSFVNIRQQRRPRQFRELNRHENVTDEELTARYRFGRQAIGYITNLIADDLRRSTRRNHALPPLQQVLTALRFFASGTFLQVTLGDTAGVDKSTVSRVVTSVSHALLAKQSNFINLPTGVQLVVNKNAFYRRGGFLCVIGYVDGTHIRIQTPKDHENAYVNRKGFHSINVQGM